MTDEEIREAAREAKRQYYRAYRAKNKERIRTTKELWWARRAERGREQNAETVAAE